MQKYHQSDAYKEYQKKYHQSDAYKEYKKKYQQSDAYKEYKKKYQQSDAFKESQKKYHQSDAYKEYKKKYHQSDAYKKYQQSEQSSRLFYGSIISSLNRKKERLNEIRRSRIQMPNITITTIKGLEDDILIYQNYVDNYNKLRLRLKTIKDKKIRDDVEARTLANLAEELGKGHGIPRKEIKPPIHSPSLKAVVSLGAD